jgi:hypothetical protein
MKLFGSLRELVAAVFRKDTREITLEPNAGTYSGAVNLKLPPVLTGSDVLVSEAGSQSLTNKTIDADLNTVSNIDDGNIKAGAGIDASKIGAGSVDNTEFGYLNGVTSSIQTQLGGKAASGANSDITSLSGLTTALSTGQGGTGVNSTATFPSSGVVVTEAGSATLTNKTIDGDNNTVQDLGLSSLKTVLADANKAILRDAAGAVTSALIANANISPTAAIDASKIGAGSVDNTEFGYLNGVTSSIQTQLGGKASSGANSDITSLSGLTTALSIGQGGTGQTSASGAINALLPPQAANFNKYLKTDGTNVSWASASGGAGEINAVLNSSGADGTSGWVNGTSHTINTVTGATIPLSPAVPTAFTMSSSAAIAIGSQTNASGDYYEFTMPPALRNRKLKFEFYYTTPASADGTWGVAVYNGATRVRLSTDTGATPDTVLPAGVSGGKFTAYFDTDAGTTYRVNFVQRTRTNTNSLWVTNVVVGPGIQPQGAVVGAETVYTPTTTGFGTIGSATVYYKRVGETIVIQGRFTCGTTAASLASIALPSGLNINTAIITQNLIVGKWWLNSSTTSTPKTGALSTDRTVNTTLVRFNTHEYATTTPPSVNLNGSQVASTGEVIWFEFQAPIAEWAGSGTLTVAQNDVEYASNSSATTTSDPTTFAYGPSGTLIQNFAPTGLNLIAKRVRFQTPIQPGDQVIVEVDEGTNGARWVNAVARIGSRGVNSAGTAAYGLNWVTINSTDVDVQFAATYDAAAADTWSTLNTWRWRVRKSSAGAAVGFGIVSPGVSSGLVSASGLPGNTTGNAIASGYVGEVANPSSGTGVAAPGATGVWKTYESITLTAGVWMVWGMGAVYWDGTNSPTGFSQVTFALTQSVNGNAVGGAAGLSLNLTGQAVTNSGIQLSVPPLIVNTNGITNNIVYMSANCRYTTLNTLVLDLNATTIYAVRIA